MKLFSFLFTYYLRVLHTTRPITTIKTMSTPSSSAVNMDSITEQFRGGAMLPYGPKNPLDYFPKFPPEIRYMIWKITAFTPRIVHVRRLHFKGYETDNLLRNGGRLPYHEVTFMSNNSVPAILHTSVESRREGLRWYGMHISGYWRPGTFYVNLKVDIIYLTLESELHFEYPEDVPRVRIQAAEKEDAKDEGGGVDDSEQRKGDKERKGEKEDGKGGDVERDEQSKDEDSEGEDEDNNLEEKEEEEKYEDVEENEESGDHNDEEEVEEGDNVEKNERSRNESRLEEEEEEEEEGRGILEEPGAITHL